MYVYTCMHECMHVCTKPLDIAQLLYLNMRMCNIYTHVMCVFSSFFHFPSVPTSHSFHFSLALPFSSSFLFSTTSPAPHPFRAPPPLLLLLLFLPLLSPSPHSLNQFRLILSYVTYRLRRIYIHQLCIHHPLNPIPVHPVHPALICISTVSLRILLHLLPFLFLSSSLVLLVKPLSRDLLVLCAAHHSSVCLIPFQFLLRFLAAPCIPIYHHAHILRIRSFHSVCKGEISLCAV